MHVCIYMYIYVYVYIPVGFSFVLNLGDMTELSHVLKSCLSHVLDFKRVFVGLILALNLRLLAARVKDARGKRLGRRQRLHCH